MQVVPAYQTYYSQPYYNATSVVSPQEQAFLNETNQNIAITRNKINEVANSLVQRAQIHDLSKYYLPEKDLFVKTSSRLKNVKYGSEEYKQGLKELKPALDHHYKVNRHHPEHFKNGIKGMNLVDMTEMLCDWSAGSMRNKQGSVLNSIEINQKRFGYSDDLKAVLENTAKDFGWA